jgi:polar amino acid transport system substrate-binding protein
MEEDMEKMRRLALMPIAMLVLAACQGGGTGGSPGNGGTEGTACAGETDGHLARICEAGVIRVSTDPEYPPQSFLDEETNELDGFDIDVAKEIAERLGVEVEFETPTFDAVTAGSWADRWDMSVGSVTVTPAREEALDFTQAYYFTPVGAVALNDSGIESLEDFAGETICVGSGTTYLAWLNGELELPEEAGEPAPLPEGVQATSLETDTDCAEAWLSGRTEDFKGWVTSLPTAQGALADNPDLEATIVDEAVFNEALAVAFDIGVEDNDSLVAAVDAIIGEMHEDGTLSALSEEWYEGVDYSQPAP